MVTQKTASNKEPRVRWHDDERRFLAERAALLIFNGEAGSPLHAIRAAQLQLHPSRRRDMEQAGAAKLPWFHAALSAELAKLREQAGQEEAVKQEAAKQAAAPTPHLNGAASAETLAEPVETPVVEAQPPGVPEPVNRAATDLGHAFVNLRAMLVDELASVFVEAAFKAMGSAQFGGEPHVRITEPEPNTTAQPRVVFQRPNTVRKPAVLVVGLKGSQKTEIQRDYGGCLDLRFIGSDESKDQLRAMTEKAETTVIMSDFISHSHEDIVKARSKHYIKRSGGLTQLRDALAGLTH